MRWAISIFLILLLCAGATSAWQIQSDQYNGTVEFFENETGVAVVEGYPTIVFTWERAGSCNFQIPIDYGCTHFVAHYWFYHVPFQLYFIGQNNEPVIVSPLMFPGARLTP